jgi:polyisoprenoid-binding protein YceI
VAWLLALPATLHPGLPPEPVRWCVVALATLAAALDAHLARLRGADFLNAREFPTRVFRADRATRTAEREFRIEGELELPGVRRPVTLRARRNKSAPYLFDGKAHVVGVSARVSFKRSDFGMNYSVDNGWAGDEVELIIEFEARRQ